MSYCYVGLPSPAAMPPYRKDQWPAFESFLESSGLDGLFSHPRMTRLSHIRHFGLLPLYNAGASASMESSSRLEHSVGVAFLAYRYGCEVALERLDMEGLIAAAILHDVSHTPFSHSLEKVFSAALNWDHNEEAPAAAKEVMDDVGIRGGTAERTWNIVRRNHRLSSVLYGPAGLDALENVWRGVAAFAPSGEDVQFNKAVRFIAWARSSDAERKLFSKWRSWLYQRVFWNPTYQLFERLSQAVVYQEMDKLRSHLNSLGMDLRRSDLLQMVDDHIDVLFRERWVGLSQLVRSGVLGPRPLRGHVRRPPTVFLSPGRRYSVSFRQSDLSEARWVAQYEVELDPVREIASFGRDTLSLFGFQSGQGCRDRDSDTE